MLNLLSFRKHWRIAILGALVSLVAIYFIINQVDLVRFGTALGKARYVFLIPTVLLLLAGLVTRALRWRVLLGHGLPLRRAFSIMNVAYLVNGVLPLRIGEVARAYLASRGVEAVPWMQSAGTIIVERLLDLVAVVVLMSLALTAGPVPPELRTAGALTAPAALVGFLVLVLLARQRPLVHRVLAALTGRFTLLEHLDLLTWFDHFLAGIDPLTRPAALVRVVFWTAISWGFSVVAGYILMFAFYPEGDWAATALFIAAAAFAIALPAVPGNIGTYEASILLALGAIGYDPMSGTALAFAVMVHGVNVAVHSVTGLAGFIHEGISLAQLSQGVQQMQQQNVDL